MLLSFAGLYVPISARKFTSRWPLTYIHDQSGYICTLYVVRLYSYYKGVDLFLLWTCYR